MPSGAPPSGLELSRAYYAEVVGPVLTAHLSVVPHAAARLGPGSEVLGFDTDRSTDHDWAPHLQIFVADDDVAGTLAPVLAELLPSRFHDVPTKGAVVVTTVSGWMRGRLGFDPLDGVRVADWMATPTQRLAEVTAGAVFADASGSLATARERLAWYPDDVWRAVLAGQFARVGQEEGFVGRCGEVGDELGSAVVGARLARDLIRLCLLLARRYPPYSKWLGSAFARLPDSGGIGTALGAALRAVDWPAREAALCLAYEEVGRRCNALGLAEPVDPAPRQFHDRPFRVLDAGRLATALRAAVADPAIRDLPPVGAIDQYVDSTDVLTNPQRFRAAASWTTGSP